MTKHYKYVQDILSDASKGSNPHHDNQGRFWEKSLSEFKKLVIYDQKLIADPGLNRGARSALVKALRGEKPFDRTVFNRMPFGLPPVKPEDIDFIQSWIDAGLPDAEMSEAEIATHSVITGSFEVFNGETTERTSSVLLNQTGAVRADTNQPRIRKNINRIPSGELENYKHAISKIKSLPAHDRRSFDYWAGIHANHCRHGTQLFLPWHRAYLIEFENVLREFVPSVTIPYWDWINDRKLPSAFTIDANSNPLFDETRNPGSIPESYIPTKKEWDDVQDAPNWDIYGGGKFKSGENEYKTHNPMHNWVGGSNGNMTFRPTAAFDPIFWSFHCAVDRQWDLWQKKNPRLGPTTNLDYVLDGVNLTVKDVLTVEQLNYEYASSESLTILDNTVALTSITVHGGIAPENVDRASSVIARLQEQGAKIKLGATRPVRGLAAVQFHQVKYPKESLIVHIFVNTPEASKGTPRNNNPNYAGRFTIWGHGECWGGQGHCDVPANARTTDSRHHLMPFDINYDISQCVAKIGAFGKEIDVSIVVDVLGKDVNDETTEGLLCDQISVVSRV